MNRLIVLIALCCGFCLRASAQQITEANYLKADSLLWAQYEQEMAPIWEVFEQHPEKEDSLRQASYEISARTDRQNVALALRYAATPSGFERLFMVRLNIAKDTLRAVLERLPESMLISPTGKRLLRHLDAKQIEVGDRYYDFEATSDADALFKLSSLEGKNILLLYGGLDCMGPDGRTYLNDLYARTSRDDFEIVIYCPARNLKELQRVRASYPCEFPLVSDFLLDDTPVKILYGAQGTPTLFFIDRAGVVRMRTIEVNETQIDEWAAYDRSAK